jgi:hypothetical protein
VSPRLRVGALRPEDDRFTSIVRALREEANQRFALADLNDFLHACTPTSFADAVEHVDLGALTPYLQNYVAAMTEQAAHQKGVAPPEWTRDIAPLDALHFATPLASLRTYLLRATPVPFKRRNIFVDAGVGDRV